MAQDNENRYLDRLKSLPRRQVILSRDSTMRLDSIEREWNGFAERIRRELLKGNSDVLALLQTVGSTPVSEQLAGEFLQKATVLEIPSIQRTNRAALGKLLLLPKVPDEELVPDIKSAPEYDSPESMALGLEWTDDPEKLLNDWTSKGKFMHGVTPEERALVVRRYKFARDLKMLALGAELMAAGKSEFDDSGEMILENGIRIGIDPKSKELGSIMLNPLLWKKRKQLKDRVYTIEVDGKEYILKERKTARHKDTMQQGHIESLTSKEEFQVATLFYEEGAEQDGDISIAWERPLGYVEFPDGFQFTVFQKQDNLETRVSIPPIAKNIRSRAAKYENEYTTLKRKIQWDLKLHGDEFSFEIFAAAKANRLIDRSDVLRKEVIAEKGYKNKDMDGFGFVFEDGAEPALQVLMFDCEYYSKSLELQDKSPRERRLAERRVLLGLNRIPHYPSEVKTDTDKRAYNLAYKYMVDEEKRALEQEEGKLREGK